MIRPIYTYGSSILRKKTIPVEADSEALQELIGDMIETMHNASGIGLAAPQIGRTERLFVIDLSALSEEVVDAWQVNGIDLSGPVVFINPELEPDEISYSEYEEGCLSIPDINEIVERPDTITVRFLDRHFEPRTLEVGGMAARVIQHEFDHLNGILFIDRISMLRRRLLKRRLRDMSRGIVEAQYPLKTP